LSHQIHEQEGFTIVALSGEVDLSNSPEVRTQLLDILAQKKNVLIDLADVSYIDSSGIASLVEGYQKARDNGLRFGLVNVSEVARNVLQLAHLDKVFPISNSVADFTGGDC
jgi:anti-sigma B factor antagonist